MLPHYPDSLNHPKNGSFFNYKERKEKQTVELKKSSPFG